MKNILLLFFTILFACQAKSQFSEAIIIFYYTNFENNKVEGYEGFLTDSINHWIIDTSNHENIWQIGKPDKMFFDSAWSSPTAIVTDTIKHYPVNNHSTFQINLKKPWYFSYRYWSEVTLNFFHKFDIDTLHDGGYIDVSYDGGKTFTNIIDDNYYNVRLSDNLNLFGDTITGGIHAISGNSKNNIHADKNGWIYSQIAFFWEEENWDKIDSMIIRFNFVSDSIDNSKEGWLIDDIFLIVNDFYSIGINNNRANNNKLTVFPNPAVNFITVKSPETIESLEIYSLEGMLVYNRHIHSKNKNINIETIPKGLYLIKVKCNTNIYTAKIIKQ